MPNRFSFNRYCFLVLTKIIMREDDPRKYSVLTHVENQKYVKTRYNFKSLFLRSLYFTCNKFTKIISDISDHFQKI